MVESTWIEEGVPECKKWSVDHTFSLILAKRPYLGHCELPLQDKTRQNCRKTYLMCERETDRNPDPGIRIPCCCLPDLPVAAETLVDGLDVLRQVGPFHRQAKERRPYIAIRSERFFWVQLCSVVIPKWFFCASGSDFFRKFRTQIRIRILFWIVHDLCESVLRLKRAANSHFIPEITTCY